MVESANDDPGEIAPAGEGRILPSSDGYHADLGTFVRTTPDGVPIATVLFTPAFSSASDSEQVDSAIKELTSSGEQVNNRRQAMNTFFLSINTVLLGSIGWMLNNSIQIDLLVRLFFIMIILLVGAQLCQAWQTILKSYLLVSKSKIALVEELEKTKTVKPFTAQYCLGKANKYKGMNTLESEVANKFRLLHTYLLVLSTAAFVAAMIFRLTWRI